MLVAAHAPVRTAIVHPCDAGSLRGAMEAARMGLIVPVLIGPAARIAAAAVQAGEDLTGVEIIDTAHSHAAAEAACGLARTGAVDAIMKGSLHTVGIRRSDRCPWGHRTGGSPAGGLVIFPSNRVRIMVATTPIDFRNDEGPWPQWGRASPRNMTGLQLW